MQLMQLIQLIDPRTQPMDSNGKTYDQTEQPNNISFDADPVGPATYHT